MSTETSTDQGHAADAETSGATVASAVVGCTFAAEPDPDPAEVDQDAVTEDGSGHGDIAQASDDFPLAMPGPRVTGRDVPAWLRREKARRDGRLDQLVHDLEQELADAHAERDELRRMLEEGRERNSKAAAERMLAERMGTITAVATELCRLVVRSDEDLEQVRQWAEGEAIEAAKCYAEEIGGAA